MKPLHFIIMFLTLTLTACNMSSLERLSLERLSPERLKPDLERLQYTESFGLQYHYYLGQGYLQLAEYEEYVEGDKEASLHFREKYRQARKGKSVTPDQPYDENLSEAQREEMLQGQNMLRDAIEVLGIIENSVRLAEAQVNYDCWLERTAETAEKDHEELCRERFYNALSSLKQPVSHRASVYFGNNETSLNDPAKAAIQTITNQFPQRDYWRVLLTGYTDKNGSYDNNVVLSMRRAVAVRNTLAQHGVDPEKIIIEAVGEGRIPGDAEKEDSQNLRRVDVAIIPVYLAYKHKGPDIKEAFPHFFGSKEPDL